MNEQEKKMESSRSIKFRAWDKQYTNMLYNVCVHNNIAYTTPLKESVGTTIMQYTGLLDKNGKEIYEGDILNALTGHKNVVKWCENTGQWTLDGLQSFDMVLDDGAHFPVHKYSEIIGNIYQNPELLN